MLNLKIRPNFKPIAIVIIFGLISSLFILLINLIYCYFYSSIYFGMFNSVGMFIAIIIAIISFKMTHFLKNWFKFKFNYSIFGLLTGAFLGFLRWDVLQYRLSGPTGSAIRLLNLLMLEKKYFNTIIFITPVILLYPLFEEICFRGMVQTYYIRIYKDAKKSILCTSILFASMHLTSALNWGTFTYIFFLGLILSLIKESSKTLWPSIMFHSAYNSIELLVKLKIL